MLLKHEELVKTHYQFGESTHKEEVDSSIGKAYVLLLLKFGRLPTESRLIDAIKKEKALITPAVVDSALQTLETHLQQELEEDEELGIAWRYIQDRLAEPLGHWDKVSTTFGNETLAFTLSLKESLALVTRAFLDVSVFGDDAKDTKLRLTTLWNCFKSLKNKGKGICHHGIRQDFMLCLDKMYPGIQIVIDVIGLTLAMMTEHLELTINSFKGTEDYRLIVLAEMVEERHELLEKALSGAEEFLLIKLKEHCLGLGINFSLYEPKVKSYLRAMDECRLDWKTDKVLFALSTLLSPLQKSQESIPFVQAWALEHFRFEDQKSELLVKDYVKTLEIRALVLQYAPTLSLFGLDYIDEKALPSLNELLDQYEKDCFLELAPCLQSYKLNQAIVTFEKAIHRFKEDSSYRWVEDFFARFKEQNRELLFTQLQALPMREKLTVSETFLNKALPVVKEGTDISPYVINRIFLHAILNDPGQWDVDFFVIFQQVLTYVQTKFSNVEQTHAVVNLSTHSYPKTLINQLVYLKNLKVNGEELRNPYDTFFIPMFHLIKNHKDLLAHMNSQTAFFQRKGLQFLKEKLALIVQTPQEFAKLFRELHADAQKELCSILGSNLLKMIPNVQVLVTEFFGPLYGASQKLSLLDCLQGQYENLIKDVEELIVVLSKISYVSEGSKAQVEANLIASLSKTLSLKVKTLPQLTTLFTTFSNASHLALIDVLKEQTLTLIQTPEEGLDLFEILSPEAQRVLYTLHEEKILKYLKDGTVFTKVLRGLATSSKEVLLSLLQDNIATIISNDEELRHVLIQVNSCNAETQTNLIISLSERISASDTNFAQLLNLIRPLSFQVQQALLGVVKDKLAAMIKIPKDFSSLFNALKPETQTFFCKAYEKTILVVIPNGQALATVITDLYSTNIDHLRLCLKDKLTEIIQDGDELTCVLKALGKLFPHNNQAAWIEALSDSLNSKVKTFDQLLKIINSLHASSHMTVLTLLKDKLPTFVQNATDFVSLYKILSEEGQKFFYGVLESKILDLFPNGKVLATALDPLKYNRDLDRLMTSLKDKLGAIIKDGDEIASIFEATDTYSNPNPHALLVELLGGPLGSKITTPEQLIQIFKKSNSSTYKNLLTVLKEKIPTLIENETVFSTLFTLLEVDEKKVFYTLLETKILKLIPNGRVLAKVLAEINNACAQNLLINYLGDKILDIIGTDEIRIVFDNLQVWRDSTDKLIQRLFINTNKIKTASDLLQLLEQLPERFHLALIQGLKHNLADLVQTPEDFSSLFYKISYESQAVFCQALSHKITKLIPDSKVGAQVLAAFDMVSEFRFIGYFGKSLRLDFNTEYNNPNFSFEHFCRLTKNKIKTVWDLDKALAALKELDSFSASQLTLLSILGDHLNSLAPTFEELNSLIKNTHIDAQPTLYKAFAQKMLSIMPNGERLSQFLYRIPLNSRPILMAFWGDKVQVIIQNTGELGAVLQGVEAKGQDDLLALLAGKLHELIPNQEALEQVLSALSNPASSPPEAFNVFKRDSRPINLNSFFYKSDKKEYKSLTDRFLAMTKRKLTQQILAIIDHDGKSHLTIDKEITDLRDKLELEGATNLETISNLCRRGSFSCKVSFWGNQEELTLKKEFFDLLRPVAEDNLEEITKALKQFSEKLGQANYDYPARIGMDYGFFSRDIKEYYDYEPGPRLWGGPYRY